MLDCNNCFGEKQSCKGYSWGRCCYLKWVFREGFSCSCLRQVCCKQENRKLWPHPGLAPPGRLSLTQPDLSLVLLWANLRSLSSHHLWCLCSSHWRGLLHAGCYEGIWLCWVPRACWDFSWVGEENRYCGLNLADSMQWKVKSQGRGKRRAGRERGCYTVTSEWRWIISVSAKSLDWAELRAIPALRGREMKGREQGALSYSILQL